jgi:hypothetical protein
MTATVTPPETACEQTTWLPSRGSRVVPPVVPRTYGRHSETRHLDDVAVTVAELLAAHTPVWPTREEA